MILRCRIAFLAVVIVVAFLERFYLGPLGFDWLIGSIVITTVMAIGWMRTYWDASRCPVLRDHSPLLFAAEFSDRGPQLPFH